VITQKASLAASPSPPGQSQAHAAKKHAVGGEGLASFALDHVSLECQLHVTCELVEGQLELDDDFCRLLLNISYHEC